MSTRAMSLKKMRYMTVSGMFAAVIFVLTAYLHIPTGAGYTHAGDGMIYLAASILPTPYAMAAAAIGGVLADGLSGYAVWIPATLVIKAAIAAMFTCKSERILSRRNIIALIPAALVSLLGYCLYEGIVMAKGISAAALIAAFTQSPSYIAQAIAGSLLYIIVGGMMDKTKIKLKIDN